MAVNTDKNSTSTHDSDARASVEQENSKRATASPSTFGQRITSPLGALFIAVILMASLFAYGVGASVVNHPNTSTTNTTSSMNMGNTSTNTTNVPNATASYGNQLAKYSMDADGAKHFTFTAKQVMWEPVKGSPRVLAWTLDGTVPGPMIRVTANDHVRVTINNQFPEGTTIHWHGLQIPTDVDGVPSLGMNPIDPGKSYTYDFTVSDQDVGTHWYHSHYDCVGCVWFCLYGAFIVDPRPGSLQAQQEVHADVEYIGFVSELAGYYVVNGKSFPDTQPINVKHGQTVRMRLIGAGEMMHPMHLHGHSFNIIAEDGHTLAQPIVKDTVQMAPGETYDLTFYAWAAPGSVYPFHCHILSHVMNPNQSGSEMGGLIVAVVYAK